jgi:hypothetical protein
MALHIWYWILMLLLLLTSVGYGIYSRNWYFGGSGFLIFLLFLVLGLKNFGSPFNG